MDRVMKHKHAEIVIAWANGATIQYQSPTTDKWYDVVNVNQLGEGDNYLEPNPLHPEYDWYDNWRIKP
jgi:hypothetical protein